MSRFRFFPILFLIVLSAQIVFAQDQSEQDAVASALAKYYPKLHLINHEKVAPRSIPPPSAAFTKLLSITIRSSISPRPPA